MSKQKKIILRPSASSKSIYAAVSKALSSHNVSFRILCSASGVSRMTLWQWREELHAPRIETIIKLSRGLNKVGINSEVKIS